MITIKQVFKKNSYLINLLIKYILIINLSKMIKLNNFLNVKKILTIYKKNVKMIKFMRIIGNLIVIKLVSVN